MQNSHPKYLERLGQIGRGFGFDTIGINLSGILALTQNAACWDEPGGWEGLWPHANRDISDRVADAIDEAAKAPGPSLIAADGQIKPAQPLGLEAGIGLGHVIANTEGPVKFIQGWRPETRIDRASDPLVLTQTAAKAKAGGGLDAILIG
jgi:hypothetical protein